MHTEQYNTQVGLVVESEDPFTGSREHICKAFFVFVAKPSDGSKVSAL